MVESPLMTVRETAAFLRVDAQTVRRMIKRGDLPGVRVGGQWRIDTGGGGSTPVRGSHGPRDRTPGGLA
jgi:excisionase family DNA binding protein